MQRIEARGCPLIHMLVLCRSIMRPYLCWKLIINESLMLLHVQALIISFLDLFIFQYSKNRDASFPSTEKIHLHSRVINPVIAFSLTLEICPVSYISLTLTSNLSPKERMGRCAPYKLSLLILGFLSYSATHCMHLPHHPMGTGAQKTSAKVFCCE